MIDITTELDELAQALAELDDVIAVATVVETEGAAESDYMSRQDMDSLLAGAGLLKGDTRHRTFTKSKEVYANGIEGTQERRALENAARERNAAKLRMRLVRTKARRIQRDKTLDAKPVNNQRMSVCLQLLGNLDRVIADITMQRYNRFRRTLGDVLVEDIAQDAIIAIAQAMSKSDVELADYAASVLWLKGAPQPFMVSEGPQGAGRLLGLIVRVIGSTIVATYRKSTIKTWTLTVGDEGKDVWVQRDTTVESLDKLATIAHNTVGDLDTLLAKHVANGKPKQKSTPPGMRDKRLFARAVIDAAVEARDDGSLGWLMTMMLDDERRRTDGSFKWTENADTIWAGFGFPPMTTDSPRLKADYARKAVRLKFAWLPALVQEVYGLIDSPELMWFIDAVCGPGHLDFVASKIKADRTNQEHQHAIDGGTSVESTMRMIEDPAYRKASLACIITHEYEDIESD